MQSKCRFFRMEHPAGIELVQTAWEAIVLPLNYGCIRKGLAAQINLIMLYAFFLLRNGRGSNLLG